MVRKLIAFLLIVLCLPLMGAWPNTGRKYPQIVAGGAAFQGPGDVVSGAAFWYGLRAYTAAIASSTTATSVNLMRSSDSHTCDILLVSSGGLGNTTGCSTGGDNGTAVATWCNATTCSVTKAYDQTVGLVCQAASCDVVQATAANQPTIIFNGLGTSPTMTFNGTAQRLISTANLGAFGQPFSFSMAYKFTGASQGPFISANPTFNAPQIGGGIVGNDTFIYAGTVVEVSATDNVNHAGQFAFNSASSSTNVDGTSSTSLNPGTDAWGIGNAQHISLGTDDSATHFVKGNISEIGMWLTTTFSTLQQTNLCKNQQTYYGSGNFGAAC